ncbi:MAG TPA: hypothetical protein VD993_10040 [Chitinophagaceae bacterium]|nr:hypothetical protein [Chitinophagaceae bacterium]
MIGILNGYLIQHKSISIPGLGTIYLERLPAMNDFSNREIHPPSYRFRFDKYFDAPDKDFFSFLATHKDIPEYEAIKQYNEFAYELRSRVRHNEKFHWPEVGTLSKELSGEIHFESAGPPSLLQPVPAHRVIRHDAQHALLVGDQEMTTQDMSALLGNGTYVEKESWWIYALILFAVALIILFFHFFRAGWGLETIGSQ